MDTRAFSFSSCFFFAASTDLEFGQSLLHALQPLSGRALPCRVPPAVRRCWIGIQLSLEGLHLGLGLGQELLQTRTPTKRRRSGAGTRPHPVLGDPPHRHEFRVQQARHAPRQQLVEERLVSDAELRQRLPVYPNPTTEPAVRVVALAQPLQRASATHAIERRVQPQRQQDLRGDRTAAHAAFAHLDGRVHGAEVLTLNPRPNQPCAVPLRQQRLQIHRAQLDLVAVGQDHPRPGRLRRLRHRGLGRHGFGVLGQRQAFEQLAAGFARVGFRSHGPSTAPCPCAGSCPAHRFQRRQLHARLPVHRPASQPGPGQPSSATRPCARTATSLATACGASPYACRRAGRPVAAAACMGDEAGFEQLTNALTGIRAWLMVSGWAGRRRRWPASAASRLAPAQPSAGSARHRAVPAGLRRAPEPRCLLRWAASACWAAAGSFSGKYNYPGARAWRIVAAVAGHRRLARASPPCTNPSTTTPSSSKWRCSTRPRRCSSAWATGIRATPTTTTR